MLTVAIEMPDEQAARLDRFALSVHMTPSDATAQLVEEGLRHVEFPAVEFRDSVNGRQAYVVGSSLAVWEVMMIAESYGGSADQTAAHLRWPLSRIKVVLAYARMHAGEISVALEENRAITQQDLQNLLPRSNWV
jgi:hypothetical protein